MPGTEAALPSESTRAFALADVAALLAGEAALLAQQLQEGAPRANPVARRAAQEAHAAAQEAGSLCRGPSCPMETHRQALLALHAAAVAVSVARQALAELRAEPAPRAPVTSPR